MARPTRGARLGAGPAHEKAILRGLSRSLILHGRVVTTEVKAKKARPFVEKLITKARKGGLHNRRGDAPRRAILELGDAPRTATPIVEEEPKRRGRRVVRRRRKPEAHD